MHRLQPWLGFFYFRRELIPTATRYRPGYNPNERAFISFFFFSVGVNENVFRIVFFNPDTFLRTAFYLYPDDSFHARVASVEKRSGRTSVHRSFPLESEKKLETDSQTFQSHRSGGFWNLNFRSSGSKRKQARWIIDGPTRKLLFGFDECTPLAHNSRVHE